MLLASSSLPSYNVGYDLVCGDSEESHMSEWRSEDEQCWLLGLVDRLPLSIWRSVHSTVYRRLYFRMQISWINVSIMWPFEWLVNVCMQTQTLSASQPGSGLARMARRFRTTKNLHSSCTLTDTQTRSFFSCCCWCCFCWRYVLLVRRMQNRREYYNVYIKQNLSSPELYLYIWNTKVCNVYFSAYRVRLISFLEIDAKCL